MSKRYVSITKSLSFQGKTEEFSNVYLYEFTDDSESALAACVTAVVAAEKLVHTAAVTFLKARVYTTEGLNGSGDPGNMYYVTDLTGTGSLANSGTGQAYRECAVLVKFSLPRKVGLLGQLGRHRSLKKWVHLGGGGPFTASEHEGNTVLSTSSKTPFITYGNSIANPNSNCQIIAPDGTPPNGIATVHPYMEHRQFRKGRRFTL